MARRCERSWCATRGGAVLRRGEKGFFRIQRGNNEGGIENSVTVSRPPPPHGNAGAARPCLRLNPKGLSSRGGGNVLSRNGAQHSGAVFKRARFFSHVAGLADGRRLVQEGRQLSLFEPFTSRGG